MSGRVRHMTDFNGHRWLARRRMRLTGLTGLTVARAARAALRPRSSV